MRVPLEKHFRQVLKPNEYKIKMERHGNYKCLMLFNFFAALLHVNISDILINTRRCVQSDWAKTKEYLLHCVLQF